MRTFYYSLSVYFIWNLLLFLCVSFYYISFDISIWSSDGRFMFCFLGIGIGLLISAFTFFLIKSFE